VGKFFFFSNSLFCFSCITGKNAHFSSEQSLTI
jgi:hypothetical protein